MAPLRIVAGLILLFLGRQLFWVFVAVLGFVIGMDLATHLAPGSDDLTVVVLALVAGILGAALAYFFYNVAITAAGFVAGGRIGVELIGGLMPSAQATWLAFIAGGIVGAILLLLVFDWALIVISSLLGASYIVQQIPTPPSASTILLIVLVIAGIAIQALMMRRGALPRKENANHGLRG